MANRLHIQVLAFILAVRGGSALQKFSTTYPYEGHGDWGIMGREPEGGSAGLPMFVFLSGTGDEFGASSNMQFVEAMARRGFISAEVDYPNPWMEYEWFLVREQWGDGGIGRYVSKMKNSKAKRIFPAALDTLCSRPRANCKAGVAVAGFDQGGFITLFSARVDDRITAIMPLGVHCLTNDPDLPDPDLHDQALSQHVPREKRLIINGGGDDFHPECLSKMSGLDNCTASAARQGCRGPSGAGFMFVPEAAHGFYANCRPSRESTGMKCAYVEGSEEWALSAATDWLAKAAAPPTEVLPAQGTQRCSKGDADTEIEQTNICITWVAMPAFWGSFSAIILLCCCLPAALLVCKWRNMLCFSVDHSKAEEEPAQLISGHSQPPSTAAPVSVLPPPPPRELPPPREFSAPIAVSTAPVLLPPAPAPFLPPRAFEPQAGVRDDVLPRVLAPGDVEIRGLPPSFSATPMGRSATPMGRSAMPMTRYDASVTASPPSKQHFFGC